MMLTLRTTLITLLFLTAGVAHAQNQPDPLQFTIAPELPGPNQLTSIKVEGVGGFIGDATITWSASGQAPQTGVGLSLFSFTTGSLGSEMRVRVTIESPTRGTFNREFVFTPSIVNLVWEAGTTVPPLYPGKALYSAGSSYKVVAFPSVYNRGSRIAAGSLSYQWSVGGEPLVGSSGLGRSTLSMTGDQLKAAEQISVDVYFGNKKIGRGEVSIPATQPKVLMYYKDSLRGVVWENALPDAVQLNSKEIALVAQPYFFDTLAARRGSIAFNWTLNGEETSGPLSAQGQLILRQSGNGQGSAIVGVSIQNNNTDQFVQAAQALLQLTFGARQSSLTNLFGL